MIIRYLQLRKLSEVNYKNELAFASRKNIDTLNTILTKAVNSISGAERGEIYGKWLSYTVKPFFLEPKFLISASIIVVIVLFFTFLFNSVLQKRVKQKTNELLKAKEKAIEGEFHLKSLLNALPDLIWLKDVNGVYLICNNRFEIFFGEKENQIIGKTDYNFVDKELADFFREHDKKAMDAGKPTINEEEITYANDGHHEFLETIKTPIFNHKNELIGVLGIGRDITLRKKQEQEIFHSKEKAEESDRLKSAFLQNMSHEIRTPLNAISGFSDLLNDPNLSDKKRDHFISIVQSSSKQLISIVNDILTISSLETKQEEANIDKVFISNILVDLHSIFKHEAQNKNISLSLKQQLNENQSEIYTDQTKITQILTNLLANALKFTFKGYIEFGYEIVENQSHTFLQFYVKDSGIGIEPEFHEKIFERFRQADKSIQMNYGGTGLGLSISRGFVELLGGKIWVQSEIEKGSIFYFTIPYKPVKEIERSKTITRLSENSRTILVAEDEEYNFLFIEELLLDLDLILIHAKDGRETIKIYESNPNIDLILMDIKMPIMTGYEAAKIIKDRKPDLPIVAQTAYALAHERAKFEEIFDDYLTKPINKVDLKRIVLKYIDIKKA